MAFAGYRRLSPPASSTRSGRRDRGGAGGSRAGAAPPVVIAAFAMAIAVAIAVAASLWLAVPPAPALAQPLALTSGPFVVATDEVAGAYRLTLHQSPERVIVGTLTYAVQVRLADAGGDAFVDDAVVRIYGTPAESDARQVAPALNTPAEPEWYLGRLELEEAGVWAIDLVVEHPEHGYASTTLALEVHERSRGGSNLVLGTVLWVLVSLAFVGATGYILYAARRNRRRFARQPADRRRPTA